MKQQSVKYFATGLILWLAIISQVSAAGIQVSPAKLDFSVLPGASAAQNLIVVNPTADVQVYSVYSDDFTELFKINPASFTLEAGDKKTVSVSILPKTNNQNIATNLSVVGKPLAEGKFNVGTGVKIPVTVTFAAAKNKFAIPPSAWLALLAIALLIAVALLIKKFRKTSVPPV